MTEHTEQTNAQPDAVPARIQLEDLIEAVTRGVARALAAQDEVSGYAAQYGGYQPTGSTGPRPPTIVVGFTIPQSLPTYASPTSTNQTAST